MGLWDDVRRLAAEGRWGELEDAFLGRGDIDQQVRGRILEADLTEFGLRVGEALREALELAEGSADVQALYWELDVDNDSSAVFLCTSYLPDLDWAADWTEYVEGPALGVGRADVGHDGAEWLWWGRAFGAFGRAFERLDPAPTMPVAFGHHDGTVLYAPLPPGALDVEHIPRTRLPTKITSDSFYALGPIGSEVGVHPTFEFGQDVWRVVVDAFRWMRDRTHSLAEPSPAPVLDGITIRVTRPPFEDAVTDGAFDWLASERFTMLLRDLVAPDTVTAVQVDVSAAETGERHPYFLLSPDHAVRPVELPPEKRQTIGNGRKLPAFRAEDLAGHRVVRLLAPGFWPDMSVYVSGDVLAELVHEQVLNGFAATEIIVLTADERSQLGLDSTRTPSPEPPP